MAGWVLRPIASTRLWATGLEACRLPCISSRTTRCFLSSNPMQSVDQHSQSARFQFRQTQVNPSILKYIERIGVGKPSRAKRRRGPKDTIRYLSEAEEDEQLGRRRRPHTTTPPPPFASNSRHGKNEPGQSIRELPVKLLARVGSMETPFPKPSPNLPEVVSGCMFGVYMLSFGLRK
jgi:hypothetical protein